MADHGGLRKHGIYFGNHNWFQRLGKLIVKQEVWLARQRHNLECLKCLAREFGLYLKVDGGPLKDFE